MSSERLILWHRWIPPRRDDPEQHPHVLGWIRSVEGRVAVAGGRLLGTLGASAAAVFEPTDLPDVLDVALDLLDEAEDAALEIAIGVAAGPLHDDEGRTVGAVVERAQLLANRARAGELVLDPACRDLARGEFLFGRQVAAGAGAARGTTIDREHPRRVDCADAMAALGPTPLPPVIATLRDEVEAALRADQPRTFVLRGPVGAGATELLASLERRAEHGSAWRVGASPGGVVPLASLRLALLRRMGTPLRVRQAFENRGETRGPARILARVAAGELVPRDDLATALRILLDRERTEGRRPWLVLSPLSLVDGASLGALLEARARGGDFVLFGRFPVESPLPRPLAELDEEVRELMLPPLKTSDARVVAEAVLGPRTDDDVARRVAVLGGDTVLGVVEAARTLIATGDLVRFDDGFVWRTGPRSGAHAIGTEALLSERLDLLDADARRVLEALCVIPDGSERALLAEVAAHDGVPEDRFERCLASLAREALARGRERPRPASSLLRWRVLSLIPPARAMELHRFVGEALRAAVDETEHGPGRVELGYYLVEGGLEAEGRPHVASAVEALVQQGYERAARQLSGWLSAVEQRGAADEAARATPAPPPLEAHEEPPPSSEIALDELLEEAAELTPSPAPTAPELPPPPSRP
ncbi:MAG TPA: hypothetical protein RMH99_22690, partial [Sandaracinaceae bacterium LLY-WYZ-13_1]|nr:hypothetical protein [Sandaracinaceae bacterium LLY-WYZ-13_1]